MNERIKMIRKKLGLTQTEFGKRLGVGKSTIAELESGRNNLSNQIRHSLLREFAVNPQFLDEGEGEMFVEVHDASELESFFLDVLGSDREDIRKRICSALAKVPSEYWDVVADLAERIANE